jgi:hypothetical protein
MNRACSTHGEKINANIILVGKPEEERLLGRPDLDVGVRIILKWI